MSAATETSKPPTSSAHVWPSETSASGIVSEQQVVEVEAREERVLADGRRERADRDDQRPPSGRAATRRWNLPIASRRLLGLGRWLARAAPASRRSLRRSDVHRARRRWISSTIRPRDITTTRSQSPASSSGSLDLTIVRDALLRLLAQRVVDVEPRGDVDALGRLLGQDHLDVSRAGTVASARPSAGCRRRATAPAARSTPCGCGGAARGRRPCAARVGGCRNPRRPSRPQHLDRRVGADAQDGEERLGRAVAAQQHDAGAERPERRPRVELACRRRSPFPVARSAPASARRNCTCPLPSAPAMPTISPLRHLEVDRPEPVAPQARDGEQHLALAPHARGAPGTRAGADARS